MEADNVTAEAAFRYTYDSRGNITAVYDTTATPETLLARYAYDEANQLVREDNVQLGKTVTYTYDKGGNITQKTEYAFTTGTPGTATDTITYTYDSVWKDRLASYDGTDIEYDEIGNPWEYTHDRYLMWQGRELRYFDTDDGYVEYRYNQDGLRCQKVFEEIGTGLEDRYDYYWTDDCRLQGYTVTMAGSTEPYSVLVLYNSAQEPIGFTVGEHTYYYIKNIQGDVLTVTDAEGTPIVNYTYDAWGAMTVSPASQNVTSQTVVNVAFLNPVTYRGYFYDYELGLYYLQSRYYDAETGRFVSSDKYVDIGEGSIGCNTFCYCINNPVLFIDSSGQAIKHAIDKGWYYRIDPKDTSTNTDRHIHVWNGKESYSQNDDGSPHDGSKGAPPKSIRKKLKSKAGWDWDAKAKSYKERQQQSGANQNTDKIVYIGGVAVMVGVGYIIYKGVRLIPSLLPPLWWTLPANLLCP